MASSRLVTTCLNVAAGALILLAASLLANSAIDPSVASNGQEATPVPRPAKRVVAPGDVMHSLHAQVDPSEYTILRKVREPGEPPFEPAPNATAPQAPAEPETPGVPGPEAPRVPGKAETAPAPEAAPGPQAKPAPEPEPSAKKVGEAPRAKPAAPTDEAETPSGAEEPERPAEAAAPGEQAAEPQPGPEEQAAKPESEPGPKEATVRVQSREGKVAVLIGLAGGATDFSTFFLEQPYRMVVDVPGKWRPRGPSEVKVGEMGLRSVRIGRHAEHLRVVFDIDKSAGTKSETVRTAKGIVVVFSK
ncbi:AMIN domain-containing protein [Desulfohalovibrio reitneri]|uniref:AMIN domain-containing protein n=1 Tax=Desulfohalovibrio reitneri TaxID=1307759 RepID=UPI0004A72D3C|nr:AMIN domain-containing protein [Desulfohalovibrio reitneri]